jgi:hypothetical protein
VTFGHCEAPLQVLCVLPRPVWLAHRALCTSVWPAERTVWPRTASRIHTGCIKGRGTSPGPSQRLPWPQSANVCEEHTDTTFALIYRMCRIYMKMDILAQHRSGPSLPQHIIKHWELENPIQRTWQVDAESLMNTYKELDKLMRNRWWMHTTNLTSWCGIADECIQRTWQGGCGIADSSELKVDPVSSKLYSAKSFLS